MFPKIWQSPSDDSSELLLLLLLLTHTSELVPDNKSTNRSAGGHPEEQESVLLDPQGQDGVYPVSTWLCFSLLFRGLWSVASDSLRISSYAVRGREKKGCKPKIPKPSRMPHLRLLQGKGKASSILDCGLVPFSTWILKAVFFLLPYSRLWIQL